MLLEGGVILSRRPSPARVGARFGEDRDEMLSRKWRDVDEEGDELHGLFGGGTSDGVVSEAFSTIRHKPGYMKQDVPVICKWVPPSQ